MVEQNESITAIVSQTWKFLDITITTETSLINNIKENVSELVIITEVKFIKKFLHAVCENCPGKKWLKLLVYIVNHKGNVHVSGDHYFFQVFILRFIVLTQFRKSVGLCLALYKYNGDVPTTLYCIVKKRLLSFQNEHFQYFLAIKAYWFEEWPSWHGDYVNDDVAKTGDKSSIHCGF